MFKGTGAPSARGGACRQKQPAGTSAQAEAPASLALIRTLTVGSWIQQDQSVTLRHFRIAGSVQESRARTADREFHPTPRGLADQPRYQRHQAPDPSRSAARPPLLATRPDRDHRSFGASPCETAHPRLGSPLDIHNQHVLRSRLRSAHIRATGHPTLRGQSVIQRCPPERRVWDARGAWQTGASMVAAWALWVRCGVAARATLCVRVLEGRPCAAY